jgi:hypothetical protein
MQLIGDLPRAEEEASRQYQEIKENWYQFQTLGRSRNAEEGYACDCQYVRGISYSLAVVANHPTHVPPSRTVEPRRHPSFSRVRGRVRLYQQAHTGRMYRGGVPV